jgi:hypothetical protein
MIMVFTVSVVLRSISTNQEFQALTSTRGQKYGLYFSRVPSATKIKTVYPCFINHENSFEQGTLRGDFIPRYGFTEDEIYLLAQLLCGDEKTDGDGEYDFAFFPVYGKDIRYDQISLVLCVVMNRVRSGHGGKSTVTDVVLARAQFVVFPNNLNTTPSDIAIEKVRDWCEAYDRWDSGVQSIPENHLYFYAGPNLTNVSRANWR